MFSKLVEEKIQTKKEERKEDELWRKGRMFAARLEEERKKYQAENDVESFYKMAGISKSSYFRLQKSEAISNADIDEICCALGVNPCEWTDISAKGFFWLVKKRIKDGEYSFVICFFAALYVCCCMAVSLIVQNDARLYKGLMEVAIVYFLTFLVTKKTLWGLEYKETEQRKKDLKMARVFVIVGIIIWAIINVLEIIIYR